jgi:iron complex outermembrane receptor protein
MLKRTILVRALRVAFSASAMSIVAQPLFAQEASTDGAQKIQRVEITGSAIKRIDAETAVPVTVLKMDDLKKQGVTTIEQVMARLSVAQGQQGTNQTVGANTGGASFADLRGIGANKTLVLLNGRRLANNALDSSAPDLNMIPFAALERVEVLRDGASALYGSDAVGGVINFITRKDFQGGTVTLGADSPQRSGGMSHNANIGFGIGDLGKDGWNVFAVLDHQKQHAINGTQRPFNKRYPGGISSSTSPANYFQDDKTGNPAAPGCTATNLIQAAGGTGCKITTSPFVDYVPKSERTTGLIKGTLKLSENHELGIEYLATQSTVSTQVAPVPYGGLIQNRLRPDGSPNLFYPGNSSAFSPNIALSSTFDDGSGGAGSQPGFVHVKWRDLPHGQRKGETVNTQQRLVTSLTGVLGAWDYGAAVTYNENKVKDNLASGYSDGDIIATGVLNGVINPFGAQNAAGTALLNSAALSGNVQNAKGTTTGIDAHASREVGDWLGAGRPAALAIGGQMSHEKFENAANFDLASKVIASFGLDPNSFNQGSRNVSAVYAELNVPIIRNLDVTAALRYDQYSDFGSTTNPKVSFRYQPTKQVLLRGSYSTGFRAPSLYEVNASQSYTNTTIQNDPVNCPGGNPVAGKPSAANCDQQFQSLTGGNKQLSPETSKNATFGIVFEPVNNLTLSADFWAIKLKHAIGVLNQDDVFADPGTYPVYHRTAAGNLATDGSQCPNPLTCGYVDLRTQNLGGTNTNGIDLSANYKLRTGSFGSYAFVLNSTYVNKYEYQNSGGGAWQQKAGIYSGTGPIFRWQNNAALNWTGGQFGAGLAAHYKTGYVDQQPTNQVASYTTIDSYVSWAMPKALALTFGIRNMFDRNPPLSFQTETFQAGYDSRFTDPTGRTFYLRGTYTF